mmetsp:Transcript_86421/g.241785  ORF Transcript_86421/g.241785 Transcript_86421/m.241785 type:complete len:274 (-) Transcript_86421:33-854(-)
MEVLQQVVLAGLHVVQCIVHVVVYPTDHVFLCGHHYRHLLEHLRKLTDRALDALHGLSPAVVMHHLRGLHSATLEVGRVPRGRRALPLRKGVLDAPLARRVHLPALVLVLKSNRSGLQCILEVLGDLKQTGLQRVNDVGRVCLVASVGPGALRPRRKRLDLLVERLNVLFYNECEVLDFIRLVVENTLGPRHFPELLHLQGRLMDLGADFGRPHVKLGLRLGSSGWAVQALKAWDRALGRKIPNDRPELICPVDDAHGANERINNAPREPRRR